MLSISRHLLVLAFNNEGQYSNGGDALFRKIGAYLEPNDATPTRRGQ